MQDFAELHLKPETLARYGLPDIPYPIPAPELKSALLDHEELPLAAMLHGLQRRSKAYLPYWEKGLSINWGVSDVPEWRKPLGIL